MSTQALGGQKRAKAIVGIVALALSLAVFVLATQATSIWSSTGGAQSRPARMATHFRTQAVNGSQIPAGCWVKYGCHRGGPSASLIANGGQIPEGCRVKFGC
jgi:hypothetical protein